jgi:hypothetical protein
LKLRQAKLPRTAQGDIIRDVEYIEYVVEKRGVIEVSRIVFPLVVVLTQDCDLQWDFQCRFGKKRPATQDKALISVLVAPIYNADHVFGGEQLSELEVNMRVIQRPPKTEGKQITNNQIPRYHYLEFDPQVALPPSIIDFKHYFSVNVNHLRSHREGFVGRMAPLFREDVCRRFAEFLSRIALPE